jgi:hypothetical protein
MTVDVCLVGALGALIAGSFVRATPMYWTSPRNQIVQVVAFALMSALAACLFRVVVGS